MTSNRLQPQIVSCNTHLDNTKFKLCRKMSIMIIHSECIFSLIHDGGTLTFTQ